MGALWKHKDRNGVEYFAGDLSPFCRVLVFKNHRKSKATDPDFFLKLAETRDRGEPLNKDDERAQQIAFARKQNNDD